MMPPEFFSTEPCEVHLIDTSPEQKEADLPVAITAAAGKAFNDMFHKCRAEVSMDWWQRIWSIAVRWAWTHAAPLQQETADPHRARLAEQAGAIDIDQLSRALVALGISQPEGREELAARVGLFVNSLTFFAALTPPVVAAPAVPDGWRLVPVEPTNAMLHALWKHRDAMRGQSENKIARASYSAMLDAAPSAAPAQAGKTPVAAEDLVLLARSLQIADTAMFDVLQNNCVDQDGRGLVLGLTNASASEVHALAEADENILEAVDWLHGRGYVVVARDAFGEHIVVERRPGE
jgi:hypothetical protein